MLTMFAMCIILTGTVHATPSITDFIVVENMTDNIIGGDINRLAVEYDSQDIDVIYNFNITSPYPFWNDTPEIAYIEVDVDDHKLNCTNRTTHNQTVFELACDYHLNAGHHNTTITFQFAHNIMPSNYSFGLEILHYEPQETVSHGSNYRTSSYNTYIIKVIRDWKKPSPIVIVAPLDVNETDDIVDNTTMGNVSAADFNQSTTGNVSADNLTGEIIMPPIPDSGTKMICIVSCVIVCGLIIVWFRMRKKLKKGLL